MYLRGPAENPPLQPTFPPMHAGGDSGSVPLLQPHNPPQPPPAHRDASPHVLDPGADLATQLGISSELGETFALGLELFGYGPDAAPFFQGPPSTSQVQDGRARATGAASNHAQDHGRGMDADIDVEGAGSGDANVLPDFTLTDDTLRMWSSMPMTVDLG